MNSDSTLNNEKPQRYQEPAESAEDLPRTEPIRTGRSQWTARGRYSTSRSRSRQSRSQAPVLERFASHLDDHGGYVHDHTAGDGESDHSDDSGAAEEEETTPVDSHDSDDDKDKADEVPTTKEGIAEPEDVEAQAKPPLERTATSKSKSDPNLVTWNGPDDPENPKNWTTKRKWAATFVVSSFTFISPVASSMVAPALTTIATDFGITSEVESQLVLSVFILAYAIGPLFLGPLSELFGRRIVLQLANVFFFAFNLGCGFAQNKGQMIAFRFMSGLGGSAPLSIGGGVLGDCWLAHERGKAIAVYSLMPLIGPAVGPIAGGFITENTTWRWAFWATSIACALIQGVGWFYLQETYSPEILRLKKVKLIKETGNNNLFTEFEHAERSFAKHMRTALVRPFIMMSTQPIIQVLALYIAYVYGLTYLVLSTFPELWTSPEYYNESIGIGGLNYISLGLGYFLGTQITAPINDRIYRRLRTRNDGVGRSEFRIPLMVPGSIIMPIGLFWYGWTAQTHQHWILPNIGAVIYSAGAIMIFQCIQTYIVDAYTRYAASALAAAVVLRSLCGFGFPLFAPYMYAALGFGWGNSILGFVALAIGIPAPFLLWRYGEALREQSKYATGG
ncbi:hypothetical protein LTR85_002010 [Meristemomyces frigidus]|nr:hypothetical protein LTR85_002010 [Meristemomyces frigidus]